MEEGIRIKENKKWRDVKHTNKQKEKKKTLREIHAKNCFEWIYISNKKKSTTWQPFCILHTPKEIPPTYQLNNNTNYHNIIFLEKYSSSSSLIHLYNTYYFLSSSSSSQEIIKNIQDAFRLLGIFCFFCFFLKFQLSMRKEKKK